jgi:fructose-1,6-bisphosphatase I
VAVKTVTSAVRRAGLTNLYGLAGGSNVQGEEVKKLDLIANKCVRGDGGGGRTVDGT